MTIQFLRRKEMAASRCISLSSEKRLQCRHPDEYPLMVELSPGCVASTAEDNERFNRFLVEQQKQHNAFKAIR